ncbi:hypothetical protein GCM10009087_24300 [Sphingomonas oligophenolica]
MAALIDGTRIAAEASAQVAQEAVRLAAEGIVPGLAVVLVGEDPASMIYVRSKIRQTRAAGLASFEFRLPTSATQAELRDLVHKLNSDEREHVV